jgi:uncharacterized protein DUF1707
MNENRESAPDATPVRASDAEREQVASLVSEAAGEGRLTLAEAEERLAQIYVVKYRNELGGFTADLPDAGRDTERTAVRTAGRGLSIPVRLRVHAAVAVALSVMLIARFVASGAEFFWPAGPMFLLWGSLAVHAAVVGRSSRAGDRWVARRPPRQWIAQAHEKEPS